MAQAGIRSATLGTSSTVSTTTAHFVAGGAWANDVDTQFLDRRASISHRYFIGPPAFVSHDGIAADPSVIAGAVRFVGLP